ncbi:MAG: hypothetical protein ACYSYV_00660 [Planctomycetota bacterium]
MRVNSPHGRINHLHPVVREIALQHDLKYSPEAERRIRSAHRRGFPQDKDANSVFGLHGRNQAWMGSGASPLVVKPGKPFVGG